MFLPSEALADRTDSDNQVFIILLSIEIGALHDLLLLVLINFDDVQLSGGNFISQV